MSTLASDKHHESINNNSETADAVAARKTAAAQLREARRLARDPRSRLFSDSSDEVPKGILKNGRIPTKRSASECVDELSQIMADLDLNFDHFSKNNFCPHQQLSFNEADEDGECCQDDLVADDDDDADGDDDDHHDGEEECSSLDGKRNKRTSNKHLRKCDCSNKSLCSDTNSYNEKPKKSVRFDERVYETFYVASRLYDRRNFTKYHFSSRHHPPVKQNKSKKNKHNNKNNSSKSKGSKGANKTNDISIKDESVKQQTKTDKNNQNGCKLTKSQRSRQSKRDKKRSLNKRDEVCETSSDDQGYCSAMHSFSD